MRRLLLVSFALVLVTLLSLTDTQAQEAATKEVTSIAKLNGNKPCCSDKKSKKDCKEKKDKKENVAETKSCSKKNGKDKACCKKVAKKEEEVIESKD